MDERRDNIYVYLWKELNTIYVGRTVNPKSRHYQHRHIPTERTYQFSSEHHVDHPKMIIIENDLTVEEGLEREKYWINEYRENSTYEVLNKTCGGQVGELSTLTDEEKKKERNEYMKEYKKRNKIKTKELDRKYRETHKEEIRELNKKYRETHKEEIREKKSNVRAGVFLPAYTFA